jgi:hypothetical protein
MEFKKKGGYVLIKALAGRAESAVKHFQHTRRKNPKEFVHALVSKLINGSIRSLRSFAQSRKRQELVFIFVLGHGIVLHR